MLKHMTIIMLKSMFSGMFVKSKNQKKDGIGKSILFGVFGLYIIGAFGVLFGGMFVSICKPFAAIGLSWLYFGFMGVMVFSLCFIGSVFVTQNQLYGAKDNDLLLSMPVPVKYILASRIMALAALNYIYEILIVIPGAAVYCYYQDVTVMGAIIFVVSFLLLPLLILSASAIFGWLIALANTKVRNQKVVMLVLTTALFVGYMYVVLQLNTYLQMLVKNGAAIGEAIQKALPPFYYMGNAIANDNLMDFVIFLAFCIVPFAIVYYVLSASFIKLVTTNRGQKRIEYKAKGLKASSIRMALIAKDFRHFTGSTMYMFNAGIGLVFMVIGAGYLLVKGDELLAPLAMFEIDSLIGAAICACLGSMASLTIISAPSISLEAKTLWITQSMPVREKDAILAKADTHILVSLPFILISAILIQLALDLSMITRIMIFLFPIAVTVFNAYCGVALNLKYPKFDWVNESSAVKQGAAPMMAMLLAMATMALPIVLYIAWLNSYVNAQAYLCIVFALFVAGALAMYRYLVTKGAEIYKTLQN